MFYTITRYGRYGNCMETKRNWRNTSSRTRWNTAETYGTYWKLWYGTSLGSVNPYSYPCRRIRASDLWCRRQSDVNNWMLVSHVQAVPVHLCARLSQSPRLWLITRTVFGSDRRLLLWSMRPKNEDMLKNATHIDILCRHCTFIMPETVR